MTRDPVFSADDFGLTNSVNEAVERAHVNGRLGQASLMVAAPAAGNAVARARRLAMLNVGLHLVLVDGDSVLGHAKLAHITGPDGRFPPGQFRLALKYFFLPAARREMQAEVAAQFAAFAATGLTLHHADAHKHFHLHPTVARALLREGRRYGLKRVRVPAEPPSVLKACGERPGFGEWVLYAWSFILRGQIRRAAMRAPENVFGIRWSGHLTKDRLERLLKHLPSGEESEIYFHPAVRRDAELVRLMPDYDHVAEYEALLTSRSTRQTL